MKCKNHLLVFLTLILLVIVCFGIYNNRNMAKIHTFNKHTTEFHIPIPRSPSFIDSIQHWIANSGAEIRIEYNGDTTSFNFLDPSVHISNVSIRQCSGMPSVKFDDSEDCMRSNLDSFDRDFGMLLDIISILNDSIEVRSELVEKIDETFYFFGNVVELYSAKRESTLYYYSMNGTKEGIIRINTNAGISFSLKYWDAK